jgi:hypothetical protein
MKPDCGVGNGGPDARSSARPSWAASVSGPEAETGANGCAIRFGEDASMRARAVLIGTQQFAFLLADARTMATTRSEDSRVATTGRNAGEAAPQVKISVKAARNWSASIASNESSVVNEKCGSISARRRASA